MINTYEELIVKYEELIIKAIASSLSLDLTSWRWFPVVPLLPRNDCDLFRLFDIVPNKGLVSNVDDQSILFSATYGKLLDAQKESFLIKTARANYSDKKYRLNCNNTETAIFRPDSAAISHALLNGASFDFTFDSSNYPSPEKELFPSYPNFVINQPFLDFNGKARKERFVFKLHFDKIVQIPTQFGGWFSQAAFIKAYTDKSSWDTGADLVTWDDLFGANGILNFINNGLLIASGMSLEIQSFGKYDIKTLLLLKGNLLTSVWPFYLNPENAMHEFEICDDGSIKIKVTTSKSKTLLLAKQAVAVKGLVGG
jgi:hypothetical protein